ncbi:alkaline ceramidase family protein [Aspergillus uvarum CBS 121591]|uniref:Alkaline ceramidase family protein n=1 Tax=Aspergillus uvarum CBS 121591 TaxID=1448315 RepID=A0A319DDX7_9EURO|nr:alkaline ceramidase family protein [Aspergillus uvarum CBS 121591]PYH86288.1 alkaline ceramidase family protein [Aspergillus uvarum CBS 121591]
MNSPISTNSFWGPPTSHANFCEEDYTMTRYIAEFINTLTNLTYILYALHGLRHLPHHPSPSLARLVPYYGLIGVGLCSAGFHMSLKYHTQMMDDLSMLLTTTPLLHRVLTVNTSARTSSRVALVLGAALLSLAAVHIATDELVLHAVSFVGSVTAIGVRTMQLIQQRTVRGSVARTELWRLVRFGAVIFNVGYAVWLVDGWVCQVLRRWRAAVGVPWAFGLELHGWWHIFTGVGAYTFIAVIDYLVSGAEHTDLQRSVAWPLSLLVSKTPEAKAKE